jgi:hypothetical protein
MVALANENAGYETPLPEQRDTVLMAQEYLEAHPEACRWELPSDGRTATRSPKGGRLPGEQHQHGSVTCITAFLGENRNQCTPPSFHVLFVLKASGFVG